VRKLIDSITRNLLVFLMGLLVVVVVWQVFSRYILNAPSTFTDELARFLLIWVSLLGAAYFSGKNLHIAINVLPSRLSPPNRKRLNILINLIIVGFVLLVFVVGGSTLVYYTYTYLQLTPTLQIPMAFVYLIGPLSGLLIVYYKIADIIDLLRSEPDRVEGEHQFDQEEFKGSI
jgi:TRAP-type C4-dicarboxylate transport system permease small subunit